MFYGIKACRDRDAAIEEQERLDDERALEVEAMQREYLYDFLWIELVNGDWYV